jgi:thiosulfate/3-mercaptopyruvate sulfurtransferase
MSAMADGMLVDPLDLAGRLGQHGLRVLDATVHLRREQPGAPYAVQSAREDYERGHIPGAGFADLAVALSDPEAPHPFAPASAERFSAAAGELGIGAGTRVVAYSQHSPMWATRLWWLLRYFGFDDVAVLDGGLRAWIAAGLPLEQGEHSAPRAEFTARPREEMLARLPEVRSLASRDGEACLVNALSPQAFRGDGPGAYSRRGRIPGSISMHWESMVDPDSGRFRPPADIASALGDLGEPGTPPVIAYCGGGISATVDLFAFELIGRTGARLYDGSLTEWAADPDLPMEVG